MSSFDSEVKGSTYVWLGNGCTSDKSFDNIKFSVFSTLDDLMKRIESNAQIVLIVLGTDVAQQSRVLMALRSHEYLWCSYICVTNQCKLSAVLANGVWNAQCVHEYQLFLQRSNRLAIGHESIESSMTKLLAYLWIFKDAEVMPSHDSGIKSIYSYPLLESFGVAPQEIFTWLSGIRRRKVIEPKQLIDRVRFCRSCRSGHLNYVDACPSCQSIDIELVTSLHCFNCGHVNEEAKFKHGVGLSCPNCSTRLRHIGVDYDRPIENQKCNQCHSSFVDAEVIANCFSCNECNSVDDLIIQNIHSFGISQAGKSLIKLGDRFNNVHLPGAEAVDYAHFEWLVKWQNQLGIRHQQQHSIVRVELRNLLSFIENFGELRAIQLLDEFESRINETIRTTDICCLAGEHTLLLLLPNTTLSQLDSIYTKLKGISALKSGGDIALSIRAVGLPSAVLMSEVGNWLDDAFNEHTGVEL